MCGLVGFSSKDKENFNLDKIKMLLYWNQERGKDSLGFYTPEIGVIKDTGKAEDLMSKKDFTIDKSNIFIGHTRAATIGTVVKKNAHPFHEGEIILAMNGTLTNHNELCLEYGLKKIDYDVDSHILTAIINKTKNKKVLSKIIGGCAIIFFSKVNDTLYCYRNNDRPLYRGMIENSMYISSIENSLKVIGCSDVKEFKPDYLYEIKDGQVKSTIKITRAKPKENTNNIIKLDFKLIDIKDLVGMYLTPTKTMEYGNGVIFEGYSYKVIGVSKHNYYEVIIRDHNGKELTISKYFFKEERRIIKKGDCVFTNCALYYNTKKNEKGEKKLFANEDDLLIVTNDNNFLEFEVKNLITDEEGTINRTSVRYGYDNEVEEYKQYNYIIDAENANSQNEYPNSFENQSEIENQINSLQNFSNISYTEEDIFKAEVESTEILNIGDLCDFTIDQLEDQVNDIEDKTNSISILNSVTNIRSLIENYRVKSEKLLKNEINAT